jgi:hypothetical protein
MVYSDKFNKGVIRDISSDPFVKLIRTSYDIGIFGKKSAGKTILMSYLGYLHYKIYGSLIFSNYHVNYPHIRIRSIEDLNHIYDYNIRLPKVFLGDDCERWFNSRTSLRKINKELNEILLDWGKINCSLIYTAKRIMAMDIALRDGTCEFVFPELMLKWVSDDDDLNSLMVGYLNFLKLRCIRFNDDFEVLPDIEYYDLVGMSKLYNTVEKVDKIEISPALPQ